jgi:hypothetical protein
MDLLYRLEAQLTEIIPIGLVPEGVRLDVHFNGRLTHGQLAGARLRGIDYLLLRTDGIGVVDAREAVVADHGRIEVKAQGYLVPPEDIELPPPNAILAPGFTWPDVELPVQEFALMRTGVAEWQDLNTTIAAIEGSVNPGTGQLVLEARAFKPAGTLVESAGVRR